MGFLKSAGRSPAWWRSGGCGVGGLALIALGAALPFAPASALSLGGRSQVHAVIGQPLSVAVPISFADINPNAVTVRVTPGPDLPDEEALVAASVQAAYDPQRAEVRLTTPRRVLVPAIALHLVVSAGTLVVNQDIDVLVDVPDLNAQHSARAEGGAAGASSQPAQTEAQAAPAPGIRVLSIQKPESPPERKYGDAAREGSTVAEAEHPSATPPPPPPPPDLRPRTYQTHAGDTLSGIARKLALPWQVPAEPMSLALFEANMPAFAAQAPEQALPGRLLQVPDAMVVRSEPAERVAGFRAWLRQPAQPWQLRSFPSFDPPPAEPGAGAVHLEFAQAIGTVAVLGLLALLASLVLRRLRLQRLVTRYVPMSAVELKKVRRIIIPAPPPRRGLSQGSVTEKLRIKRLREMLDHNPFRSDIRYRLAERLHKAGDGRTFAQIAPPLRPSLSPEAWARVCKMGRELLPDDPRFQQ